MEEKQQNSLKSKKERREGNLTSTYLFSVL